MIKVKVSSLVQVRRCSKRCKIQGLKLDKASTKNDFMIKGTILHGDYNNNNVFGFEQEVLLANLATYGVFERVIDDRIAIRGLPDNYRILNYCNNKAVTIIEVKTTSKPYLHWFEYEMAKFQVEVYAWLLEPYLKELGYRLHKRMWVEVYSQNDYHLIKRIPVTCRSKDVLEKEIINIVDSWDGLKPISYAEDWICKLCPRNIKSKCDKFDRNS